MNNKKKRILNYSIGGESENNLKSWYALRMVKYLFKQKSKKGDISKKNSLIIKRKYY